MESALFSLDFRAEERLAQLYMQVAGRAGRGAQQGEVLLQTHYPEHPLLQSLLQQGYNQFAHNALALRKAMGLPPFSSQALFKAQSRHSEDAEHLLTQFAAYLQQVKRDIAPELQILGPMSAPFSKSYCCNILLVQPYIRS